MPTLPLYLPIDAVPADASHRVTSPGGYEAWIFETDSSVGDVRVVVAFFDGCPLDEAYLRRYRRYQRRPTRISPPVPADYPAVHVQATEGGRVIVRSATGFPPRSCTASVEMLDMRIGPNRVIRDGDGSIRLTLSDVSAELEFHPANTSQPAVVPVQWGPGEHYETTGQPTYAVRGQIRLPDAGATARTILLNGRGTHRHYFGTAPLDDARNRLALLSGVS
jgi:hypothetical protein